MSDWEVVKVNRQVPSNSEWEAINESPLIDNESKGFGGIASDAMRKAIESISGIPSALSQLPREAYGAGQQLINEPGRFGKNLLAGSGEFGNKLLNAPGNIRDYLEKKDLISHNAPSLRLPEEYVPREFDYAKGVGIEGEQAGDKLIRGIPEGVVSLPLTNKIFSALEELPLSQKLASKHLRESKNMVAERGIKKIPIEKDIFERSKDYLPNTKEVKKLLEDASKGEYNALFDLQSDLGKESRSLAKSSTAAERRQSKEAFSLREELLNAMKEHLSKTGHKDIADKLAKGQKKYSQYKKISENVYPVLRKAGIPLSGLGALGYGYKKASE